MLVIFESPHRRSHLPHILVHTPPLPILFSFFFFSPIGNPLLKGRGGEACLYDLDTNTTKCQELPPGSPSGGKKGPEKHFLQSCRLANCFFFFLDDEITADSWQRHQQPLKIQTLGKFLDLKKHFCGLQVIVGTTSNIGWVYPHVLFACSKASPPLNHGFSLSSSSSSSSFSTLPCRICLNNRDEQTDRRSLTTLFSHACER